MTRWIVVGGGTAGCVVAARLAASADAAEPGDEVVLLEAGPAHAPSTPADGDVGPYLGDSTRVSPVGTYVQGFGLGGASLVNAGVVVGDPSGYRHHLPLEPAEPSGPVGRALLAADPASAPVLLARRAGHRVTVAEAYLDDAPANLTVVTGCDVVRLAFDGRRVIGVVTAAGEELPADRVVVCAGAIGTPTLLLRSGVDTPGVGTGLQDHVGVALALDVPAPPVGGPAITVTAEHGDHQLLAVEPGLQSAGLGLLVGGWLAVRGSGSVSVPDPDGPPDVVFPTDPDGLAKAAAALFRTVDAQPLRDIAREIYVDAYGTRLDDMRGAGAEAIAAWLAAAPSPYHHAAGSCRHGVATDPAGWVHGYAGLAVCDASALPGVPRRNVFLAVIDLAERFAAGVRRVAPPW